MNKVILMGRLTKEPEIRYTNAAEPMAVARYTLAVNRRYKRQGERSPQRSADGRGGFAKQSDDQEADFINCVSFGKNGEFAEKYLKKGQMIGVVGRLQIRAWEDKEGKKNWSTDVIVEEQYFAESKGSYEAHKNAVSPELKKGMPQNTSSFFYPVDDMEDDDLPF